MKNDLVTFDTAIKLKGRKAIDFFSNKANLVPLITFVKEEATSIVCDVKTKKGREHIGSTALKVSKSRKGLTDAIDASVADMETKVITAKAISKYVEQELNAVRDTILKPRKIWQEEQDLIEENRIQGIKKEIYKISMIGILRENESKEEVALLVEAVENIDVSEGFEEFTVDAAQAVKDVLKTLNDKVISIIEADRKAEQDQQLEAERKRNKITERLHKLATIPMDLLCKSSSKIKDKIDSLEKHVFSEDEFGESYQEAVDWVQTVIGQLKSMFDQQIIIEEQARLMNIQNHDVSPLITDSPVSVSTSSTTTVIERDYREVDIANWLMLNTNIYEEQAYKIAASLMLNLLPHLTLNEY